MRRFKVWLQRHRLPAFFVLAFAISWCSWPLYAAGLMPQFEFLPIGPLAAALIIIGLAEGKAGFRAWGRRLIRWRVGWVWYAVALLLPAMMALLTGFANMALGAPAPGLAEVTWSGLLAVFAVRLVNPLDGPVGEEPGFRGYALPLLQARWTPLRSAALLGVLVSLWHLPLVLFGQLSLDRTAHHFRHHLPLRVAVQPHRRKRAADVPLPQQPGNVHGGFLRLLRCRG